MIEHTLTLVGPRCHEGRIHPEALWRVTRNITPLVRGTVRMAFLSASNVEGRPYKDLSDIWDGLELPPHRAAKEHGTEIVIAAAPLGEAAPRLFEQMKLFDDGPSPEDTAIDLVGYMLSDVQTERADSLRFDGPLLKTVSEFRKAFRHGIDSMSLGGHRLGNGHTPPAIDKDFIAHLRTLEASTPDERRVRVMGKLDMIRVSDCVFELVLPDGERLRAVWAKKDPVHLGEYLDRDVLIEGTAAFRPSGKVLRVDAEAIDHARESDSIFAALPQPASLQRSRQPQVPTSDRNGFGGLVGAWPGDESIEDIMAMLDSFGR